MSYLEEAAAKSVFNISQSPHKFSCYPEYSKYFWPCNILLMGRQEPSLIASQNPDHAQVMLAKLAWNASGYEDTVPAALPPLKCKASPSPEPETQGDAMEVDPASSGEGDSPGGEGRTPAGEARTPVVEGRTSRSGGRTPAGPSAGPGKPTRKQKLAGKKRERDPGARKTRAALKEEEEANESLEALNVLASACLVCVSLCVHVLCVHVCGVCVCVRESVCVCVCV
jgi:hypothetical protein